MPYYMSYKLPFKNLGPDYTHQGCIFMIKNTFKNIELIRIKFYLKIELKKYFYIFHYFL